MLTLAILSDARGLRARERVKADRITISATRLQALFRGM